MDERDPEWRNSIDEYIETPRDDDEPPRKRRRLTWYEKRQALADRGIDTIEEYKGEK